MRKAVSVILTFIFVFLLVGCSAVTTTTPVSSGDQPASDAVSETPSSSLSPAPLSTPIPTTPPDVTPASSPTPSPSASTVPAGIVKNSGEIIGSDVAFRTAPSTDSDVISRLDIGTYVQILKTNVNAQWHQVQYNGETGYVNRMYICLDASLDGYSMDFVGTIINCNNDVNVRSEPTTDSEIIGVAEKGETLTIVPQDTYIKDWYTVKFEGQTAYIHANYVDITAVVDDDQLSDLKISGGTLYPSFSPNEYGYVIKATSSRVTITAKANSGVSIDIDGSGQSAYTKDIPSAGMKTVRIALNGEIRYSLYISRNILTVGTWNIKRGNGKLLMQGRLIYDQQPDIMGIQESYQKLNADNIIDNLASLKTRDMSRNILSPTINYSNGGQYGNGLLSRYPLDHVETFTLDSGGYENRILQKATVTINGKTVSIYNTHLTYNSEAVRKQQFAKILSIMNKDQNEYKILTGDFNAGFDEFSVFSDYTVVNNNETKYYDYSKNEIDYSALDNIIVSKNIKVVNSRIIITSFSDHYPVFAYLILN